MTVTTTDLGTYLDDDSINTARAQMLINDAVALCTTVVNPLPGGADLVVRRVAGRAYVSGSKARQYQLGEADDSLSPGSVAISDVYLTRSDIRDLRMLDGSTGGGAFVIDTIPTDYTLALPAWGIGATGYTDPDWDAYP